MAYTPTHNQITVGNVKYYVEDTVARNMVADIPGMKTNITSLQNAVNGKVAKAGDTMSGDLNFNSGKKIRINQSGGSYGTLYMGVNMESIRVYDASGNSRAIQLTAQAGQGSDIAAVQYVGKNGTYDIDYTGYTTFSGTSLTAVARFEYANASAINSLTITWPAFERGLIFGVNFTASGSFTGVTHRTSSGSTFTPKYNSAPTQASQRYNLVCWYDGSYQWCLVTSASL